jgi:hypothetical protein
VLHSSQTNPGGSSYIHPNAGRVLIVVRYGVIQAVSPGGATSEKQEAADNILCAERRDNVTLAKSFVSGDISWVPALGQGSQ